MLLRSITKHMKEQNWFAVFIDFVIVVIGIFVGLQITDWNTSRVDRVLEREYLVRLLADVELSIERTSNTRGFMVDHFNKSQLILDSLLACELAEDKRDDFALGLKRVGQVVPSSYNLGTLHEMQSSGRFSLIRNSKIKDSLNALQAESQYENSLILSIASRAGPQMAYMDYYVVVKSDIDLLPTAKVGWNDLKFDFVSLCDDTKFLGALTMTRSITRLYIDWNDTAIEKLGQTKLLLQTELGLTPETKM